MNDAHEWPVLKRLDLNLFRVFEVVYRERNLTRAAALLHLSQSAVSHALARWSSAGAVGWRRRRWPNSWRRGFSMPWPVCSAA